VNDGEIFVYMDNLDFIFHKNGRRLVINISDLTIATYDFEVTAEVL
jgi:hypothetical protein